MSVIFYNSIIEDEALLIFVRKIPGLNTYEISSNKFLCMDPMLDIIEINNQTQQI